MIRYTDIENANLVLAEYKGSIADISLFSISHRRLAIRITKADTAEVLHLLALGCLHISGPFSWQNAQLQVSHSSEVDEPFGGYVITDTKAGFELTTRSGFIVFKGR